MPGGSSLGEPLVAGGRPRNRTRRRAATGAARAPPGPPATDGVPHRAVPRAAEAEWRVRSPGAAHVTGQGRRSAANVRAATAEAERRGAPPAPGTGRIA